MRTERTSGVFPSPYIQTTATPHASIGSATVDLPGLVLVRGIIDEISDMLIPDEGYVVEDESWICAPERQRGEAEADSDIAGGRLARFSNVEDLISDLRR